MVISWLEGDVDGENLFTIREIVCLVLRQIHLVGIDVKIQKVNPFCLERHLLDAAIDAFIAICHFVHFLIDDVLEYVLFGFVPWSTVNFKRMVINPFIGTVSYS